MSENKPPHGLVVILCFVVIGLLFWDNCILRKKFSLIEAQAAALNLNLTELGIKIRDVDGKITPLQDALDKNIAEDNAFRSEQTKFDKNLAKILLEQGLISR